MRRLPLPPLLLLVVVLGAGGCTGSVATDAPLPPETRAVPQPTPTAAMTTTARRATPVVRTPRALPRALPIATPRPLPAAVVPPPSLNGLFDGMHPEPTDDYGVVVEDFTTGARLALNEDKVFPSASLYKLGVAWMALRQADAGVLSLDDALTIEDADALEDEPDGGIAVGETTTVRDALMAMLSVSSNSAAHALLRTFRRPAFNNEMNRIGLTQTRVPENPSPDADSDETAVTSAADMARLLRTAVSPQELTATSRDELFQMMAVPTVPDALREVLPEEVDILDKTGNLENASNVTGLLRTARGTVLVVVVNHGVDPGDARALIAHVGQIVYDALLK
jgi:beta-lactamase class A